MLLQETGDGRQEFRRMLLQETGDGRQEFRRMLFRRLETVDRSSDGCFSGDWRLEFCQKFLPEAGGVKAH